MNILLPTDFSNNAFNAINYATAFFENKRCNFYVLHVNKTENLIAADTGYIATPEVIEKIYTKPSKTKLRDLLKKINLQVPHNDKHKFYTLSDYTFFIESIRKHVVEKKIDMIVMGTKGASGISQYIIGSNTGDVITKVKCTTLVIPEHAKYVKPKEIAFPSDFTLSYDIKILEPLADILYQTRAGLRIVHIEKNGAQLNTEQTNNKDMLYDFFEEFNPTFHVLTNKHVEDAIQCFSESRHIDLIAMVAKNLNYFQSILFHSKVENITYHTHIPFLVLHE